MHHCSSCCTVFQNSGSFNVDTIAKDIISVNDDVADVDADAENDKRAGVPRVPLHHLFLNPYRAGYGIDGAGELNQHAIAGCLNDPAIVSGDCRINNIAPAGLQGRKRADLVSPHQSAIPGNIRCENSSQSPLDPVAAHLSP
jgi:hypothetical protein